MIWMPAFLMNLAALGLIALAMKKHHKDVFGRAPGTASVLALRILGWLMLAGALAFCITGFGAGYGLVVDTALLNMAGIVLVLTLCYGPAAVSRRKAG